MLSMSWTNSSTLSVVLETRHSESPDCLRSSCTPSTLQIEEKGSNLRVDPFQPRSEKMELTQKSTCLASLSLDRQRKSSKYADHISFKRDDPLSQVGFALRTPTHTAICSHRHTQSRQTTPRIIASYLNNKLRPHTYVQILYTSVQLYIINKACTYKYIYIQIHASTEDFDEQHKSHRTVQQKSKLFLSAKDGECHVFPLPIGLREWL